MTEGQRPTFLTAGSLAQNFGFELIESVLANYADAVVAHPEQIHLIRIRLMPLILKILSEKMPFPVTVRVMRLLQLIISRMLFALAPECEAALGLLHAMLDPAASLWKRALALELFRAIYADSTLTRSIYEQFDEENDKKNIIGDHLGILVRLAAEKPNVIGLGQQSSNIYLPRDEYGEQAAVEAGAVVGIGTSTSVPQTEVSGISTRWSIMRISCLDLLDKAEAPNIPPSYIYALALTCINSFSDGLARFLLPFTAPSEGKSKRKPRATQEKRNRHTQGQDVKESENGELGEEQTTKPRSMRSRKESINPLSREDHVLYQQIRTSAHMIEHCWPALLAASSTFLSATLDTDYYHALIRSFQKFTQTAGLLDFSTPRDAFLTTLGKHSVPAGRPVATRARSSADHGLRSDTTDESDQDSSLAPRVKSPRRKTSLDLGSPVMTSRNLLCLRALLNLGIALGPSLEQSWAIILETLQQADLLLPRTGSAAARRQPSRPSFQSQINQTQAENGADGEDFGVEIAAAETAAARMIESTTDFSDEAFLVFAKCLCSLFRGASPENGKITTEGASNLLSPQTPSRMHQRFPSIADSGSDTHALQGDIFTVEKLHHLVQCNIGRLCNAQSETNCWDFLTNQLLLLLSEQDGHSSLRTKAAKVFGDLVVAVATSPDSAPEYRDTIRARALSATLRAITALYENATVTSKHSQLCDIEIHRLLAEAVHDILEKSGDLLQSGWETVFAILISTFDTPAAVGSRDASDLSSFKARSNKLIRPSFGSLQLICADYLEVVPLACFPVLIDTLYLFCSQNLEFNISLTVSNSKLCGKRPFAKLSDRPLHSLQTRQTFFSTRAARLCLSTASQTTSPRVIWYRSSIVETPYTVSPSCGYFLFRG